MSWPARGMLRFLDMEKHPSARRQTADAALPALPGLFAKIWRRSTSATLALVSCAVLISACVTTESTSREWGDPYGQAWARNGRVEYIRETIQRQHGDPVGGAVAGAVIGGIVGHSLGGRGAGTLFGAAGGAAIGAQASQGGGERRFYEIFVRFDDGGAERYVYEGYPPFRVGEYVALTGQGLVRR